MMRKSFHISDPSRFRETARNFGKNWTSCEEQILETRFLGGDNLPTLCRDFGRDVGGIVCKLTKLGVLEHDGAGKYTFLKPRASSTSSTSSPTPDDAHTPYLTKELPVSLLPSSSPMLNIELSRRTYVGRTDGADLSDQDIFNLMAKAEAELEAYKAITTKSETLSNFIADREAKLAALSNYVDSRREVLQAKGG